MVDVKKTLEKESVHDFWEYYIDGIKTQIVGIITCTHNNIIILPKREITLFVNRLNVLNYGTGNDFVHSFQDSSSTSANLAKAIEKNRDSTDPNIIFHHAITNKETKEVVLTEQNFKISIDEGKLNVGNIIHSFGIKIDFAKMIEIANRFSFDPKTAKGEVADIFSSSSSFFSEPKPKLGQ